MVQKYIGGREYEKKDVIAKKVLDLLRVHEIKM
jgi:hypothetical protein